MSFDYSKLLGKIKEVYGTQGDFAAAIDMSEKTLSMKVNNKLAWKQNEIIKACDLLNISSKEIPRYFFNL